MSITRMLENLKAEHVEPVQYLVSEAKQDVDESAFNGFNLKKLQDMEDDLWKQVSEIDDHCEKVDEALHQAFFQSPADALDTVNTLCGYKDDILAERKKLMDNIIRKISDRIKEVLRMDRALRAGTDMVD